MKVAIVGYGRMGREIEGALLERGHQIVRRIDPRDGVGDADAADEETLSGADVAIEFSLAPGVLANARAYAATGCSAVVGTTGWDDVRDEVRTIVDEAGIGYLWGANFSIGANIFFSLAAAVARAIDPFDEYDISVHETHHDRKADSPSGTALHVAERILEGLKRKTRVLTEAAHRKIEPDELHVSSTRLGSVPGTHVVTADSPADTIEVIHRARSRRGFALGAVRGAEWVVTRRGLFDVSDFMDSVMHEGEK